MHKAQDVLQYLTPPVVLLYYLAAVTLAACTLQKGRKQKRSSLRQTTFCLLCYVIAVYLAQSGILVADSLSAAPRLSSPAANINALSNSILWSMLTTLLYRTKRPAWYPYIGSWLITFVLELTTFALFTSQHAVSDARDYALIGVQASRFAAITLLLATHTTARIRSEWLPHDEESTSLLGHQDPSTKNQGSITGSKSDYGSLKIIAEDASTDGEESDLGGPFDEAFKKGKKTLDERLRKDGNWFTYLRGFAIFIPMMWPTKRPVLYLNMLGCVVCILGGRVLAVLKPRQFGIMVNILTSGSGSLYPAAGLYILFSWLSGASGIGAVREYLWLPVERYSEVTITTAAYNQILELSSDFHDNKQTGELYASISKGAAVNSLLYYLVFQLVPETLDLAVGFGYLYYLFGPYMALIAAATAFFYMSSITHFQTKLSGYRRKYLALGRAVNQIMYDTVGSWTTVSYFNRVPYEEDKYKVSQTGYVISYQLYFIFWSLYYSLCSCALDIGLGAALLLGAYQVSHGIKPVGNFVILLTYWSALEGPLNVFARAQKTIIGNLVDAEQLLALFQLKPKINDGQKKFVIKGGEVKFDNVKFSYDGSKQVIQGVSFIAQPGQKIALVGETGGGKSTLLKLLFRFYDVTEGSVLIDGQDVRDVTVESLRACMGVVPQDPSMFNKTVMENIRYAKFEATDEEIMEACKAAAVHDKILSFTDGYASKVGEKGVKLSGGELQRLAIARAILKDPEIILLDEATSSVDTETESRIHTALQNLTKGRTTFTVAHRLSTIMDSDIILVVKDGTILEQGPPQELLAAKGKYYDLWCKQVGISYKDLPPKAEAVVEKPNGSHQSTLLDLGFKVSPRKIDSGPSGNKRPNAGKGEHGKIWRPDAPEFIPRHLRGSNSSEIQPDQQHSTGTSSTNAESSQQYQAKGRSTGKVKSQGKRQRTLEEAQDGAPASSTTGAANVAENTQPNAAEATQNGEDGNRKRVRLNKVRRRKMSKSEPTDASASMGDGAVDGGDAPEASHNGATGQKRHVSAPMQPSSSTANHKAVGQGRRGGRKHSRARGGNSSHPRSDQSRQTSGTLSAISGTETPAEPAGTPEKSSKDDEAKGPGNGKATVRFA
ncbi:MAG: hypothetical protein LQ350_005402 [Teloschistes chrysophthalmus]|nr:MAG: hypothetical protein LQ350_005402 [Niorma chrysophthalma]